MKNIYESYELSLGKIKDSIKDNRKYGCSQAKLAKDLGITREHLNKMLSNKTPMKADQYLYLLHELHVRIEF